ncbi:MAG: aldo/keto reductase [bacterium]
MSISGRATRSGTKNYGHNFPDKVDHEFYRLSNDRWISSVGLGTYLGDVNDKVDEAYKTSIKTALLNGINLIDTAANYRFQRSERLIGDVLEEVFEDTDIERNQVVVATKGGYVGYDGDRPEEPLDYIQSNFIEPGVADEEDFTNSGHCLTRDYIEYQVHNSLKNLNLETIDLFYVQNPEEQFTNHSHEDVYDQLEGVFELLEKLVEAGKIDSYGLSSWDGLRVHPENEKYLKLESVHERAIRAGGEDHNFQTVQLPFNLGMTEASTLATQPIEGEPLTALDACRCLDLSIITAASIMQGKIAGNLPDRIRDNFSEFQTDVQRALQFNRSTPGVTACLVGMSTPEHVTENLELSEVKPIDEESFRDRFLEVVDDSHS